MMIQIQDWESSQKIIVVDEINHGTVQVEIPKPGEYKDKYYQHADCAIYNLWVDEKYRKQGVARLLMETAEKEAKKLGCKSVQLEYDKESESFVLQWYKRLGYVVTACGIGGSAAAGKEAMRRYFVLPITRKSITFANRNK